MEQRNIKVIEEGVNDTVRKCIKIPIPKSIFSKGEYEELDYDAFNRAKREFPKVEFQDPMKRDTEENGENIEFLYYYK